MKIDRFDVIIHSIRYFVDRSLRQKLRIIRSQSFLFPWSIDHHVIVTRNRKQQDNSSTLKLQVKSNLLKVTRYSTTFKNATRFSLYINPQ